MNIVGFIVLRTVTEDDTELYREVGDNVKPPEVREPIWARTKILVKQKSLHGQKSLYRAIFIHDVWVQVRNEY